jgi:glycogen synthase
VPAVADAAMRILHVFDHSLPVQSGYSFRSAAILREQRARGWETVQLTSSKQGHGQLLQEASDGFVFNRTPEWQRWWMRLPAMDQVAVVLSARGRLRDVIAAEQPDIIQAHSPCLTGLAALGLGVPLVYELRSSWEDAAVSNGTTTEGSLRYRLSRAIETYVLRRADAVTTICAGLREDIIGRGVPADRISVVSNAVDVAQFADHPPSQANLRRRLGLEGKQVLGFAGSFFAWEGLPLLIDALPEMLRSRPSIRVLLLGAGPDEGAIRSAVERAGVRQQVILAGQVRQAEVFAYYDAMDVMVYPRLPMRLTDMVTPLKPLEAMALSKVCVASDVGGHRELIDHGRTGVLFRAGDAGSLARAVLELLADVGLQKRITSEGLRYVREERTWARSVAAYDPVYRRLLSAGVR